MVSLMSNLTAPCSSSQLALAVEEFLSKAEAFLQNHYKAGSSSADVQQMLQAIANLQMDVDTESLEQEFSLHCDRTDLMADQDDSAWV